MVGASLWLAGLAAALAQYPTNPPPILAAPGHSFRSLTLAEAQREALEKNWDLLAARSDIDLATAQKIMAHEFPNPTIALSSTKINTDGQPNSTSLGNSVIHRNYDTIAAINQLLEIGGKRSSRQATAAAGHTAAAARFQDARRLLDLGVSQAYITAVLAEANVRILKQSAASLRKEAQIAAIRLNAGDISASDKSQIEIAADRLELEAQTSETTAASARISLEVLLGIEHPKGDWTATDSLEQLTTLPGQMQPMPGAAARPDLLAAQASLRKAEADLKLQKAMRIPDPTFLVQYERQPPDQPNTLGIGFSFPLPLWNRNRGAIQGAKAAKDQAAIQVGKVKAQVVADITTAELTYKDAQGRWERYQGEIIRKSAQVRETMSYAYEKGGASLLDLLTAERNDNDIRLAAAQAQADMATATAALKAARKVVTEAELRSNQ